MLSKTPAIMRVFVVKWDQLNRDAGRCANTPGVAPRRWRSAMRVKCTPIPLPIDEQAAERFWSHVQKSDGCWVWVGTIDRYGYGKFKYRQYMHSGSRFSWTLHFGEIPCGLCVLHQCDNPACVNPDHLFLGTHQENMADKVRKGRSKKGVPCNVGESNGRAKLTPEDVREIRRLLADGWTQTRLALRFGVSTTTVAGIASGARWGGIQ